MHCSCDPGETTDGFHVRVCSHRTATFSLCREEKELAIAVQSVSGSGRSPMVGWKISFWHLHCLPNQPGADLDPTRAKNLSAYGCSHGGCKRQTNQMTSLKHTYRVHVISCEMLIFGESQITIPSPTNFVSPSHHCYVFTNTVSVTVPSNVRSHLERTFDSLPNPNQLAVNRCCAKQQAVPSNGLTSAQSSWLSSPHTLSSHFCPSPALSSSNQAPKPNSPHLCICGSRASTRPYSLATLRPLATTSPYRPTTPPDTATAPTTTETRHREPP